MSDHDSHLVKRVLSGDRAAAAEFVARHRREIERHLGARVGPLLRRCAGVSDVFASLLRRLDEATARRAVPAETPSALIAYTKGIGRRTLFGKARRDERRRRLSSQIKCNAEFGIELGAASDPLERAEALQRMRTVFDELSREDQQLVRLSMDGMTAKQIGAIVGMSQEAVWQRLHRARKYVLDRMEAG